MNVLTKQEALKFCEYCDWTRRSWLLRKHLFDENPRPDVIKRPRNLYLFIHLEKVLQEYWLHQVAKLHDPATMKGRTNLGINYVLSCQWSSAVKVNLVGLGAELETLSQAIRGARHRLLSHNDLETILNQTTLGAFNTGEDIKYFEALCAFASHVHKAVAGSPFIFDDFVESDVETLMESLSESRA